MVLSVEPVHALTGFVSISAAMNYSAPACACRFRSNRCRSCACFWRRKERSSPASICALPSGRRIHSWMRWVPRLTPDGLSVLYLTSAISDGHSENVRLMRVPLSGGASQLVLEERGIANYQCASLPSTLCIYGQMEPKSEYYRFFTFDPAGAKGTELVAAKMKKEDADGPNCWGLSPDGKYLVTSKSQNPDKYRVPEVRILNLAENTERFIPVPEAGLIMGMDWAADSLECVGECLPGQGCLGFAFGSPEYRSQR